MEVRENDNGEKVIAIEIIKHTVHECCNAFLEYILLDALVEQSAFYEANKDLYSNLRCRRSFVGAYLSELRRMLQNCGVTIINGCYFYKTDTNELMYEPTDDDLERHCVLRNMIDDSDDIDKLLNDLNMK